MRQTPLRTISAPGEGAHGANEHTWPLIRVGLITYILLTGHVVILAQATLFGLQGARDKGFLLATLTGLVADIVRMSPLFFTRRLRMGLLNPLVLAVVVWPIVTRIPYFENEFSALLGIFAGESALPPTYSALLNLDQRDIYFAITELNLLETAGYISCFMAYFIFFPLLSNYHDKNELPQSFNADRFNIAMLIGILLSVSAFMGLVISRGGLQQHLLSLSFGRFAELQGLGPLLVLSKLSYVALLVWLSFDPNIWRKFIFQISVLLVIFVTFMTAGSRGSTLALVVTLGMTWFIRTGRVPLKTAFFLVPLLFFAYGSLTVLRTASTSSQSPIERLLHAEAGDVVNAASRELKSRELASGAVPVLSEGYEATGGPLWGQTYIAALTWFIPRALWEEKPRGAGSLYAQLFLGAKREGTTIPIGATAEAYWNFWIPGVILIYVVWGFLIAWFFCLFIRLKSDPFILTAYILFITQFSMTSEGIVPYIHSILMLVILRGIALLVAGSESYHRRLLH